MHWHIIDIFKHAESNKAFINGAWCPARPINWTCRTLRERIRQAWDVFIGKADSFIWPQGQ